MFCGTSVSFVLESRMERWANCVAVVTGASSGIGEAIAKDLLKSGLIVVGLARRAELMEVIKNTLVVDEQSRFHIFRCDVSKEASVAKAFDWIMENLGSVDILVNNAGCMRSGQLCTMDIAQVREVLDTNVMGVVYCTQRAFKNMRERNFSGHVVLINSVLGHSVTSFPNVMPEFNIYPASKFALTAITEIFRQEFMGLGTKVKVTSITPGVVDTDIVESEAKQVIKEAILRPEDVSNAVLFAIATPPNVQIHEIIVKPIGEFF